MNYESDRPHVLACTEVWGDNRKVIRKVKLPGLLGWVASGPSMRQKVEATCTTYLSVTMTFFRA